MDAVDWSGVFALVLAVGGVFWKFLSDRLGKRMDRKVDAKFNEDLQGLKARHERELESFRQEYKTQTELLRAKLKKSELLFDKELEAATDFVQLMYDLSPPMSHPDMEIGDVYSSIAGKLESVHTQTRRFLKRYAAVLEPDVRRDLESAAWIAETGTFETDIDGVPIDKNHLAERWLDKAQAAERKMIARVRGDSETA